MPLFRQGAQGEGSTFSRSDIDGTPLLVGGVVLGALAMLIALKLLGFRFNIGVKVGG